MIVMSTLTFFAFLGFCIPKKHLGCYMIISSICISSLYFFYTPPVTYDLYRHYEILHEIRNYNLQDIVFGNVKPSNVTLNGYAILDEYMDSSRLFLIYAYIISQFKIDALLPVITGSIIYITLSRIILMSDKDLGGQIEGWKLSFCFFYILMILDFRSISGIRNLLAFALFAYVLYWDLVRKAGNLKCFLCYILLFFVHTSIAIFVFLRILLLLSKYIHKTIIVVIALLSFSFLAVLLTFLQRYNDISFIHTIIIKINSYVIFGGSSYILSRVIIRLIMTLVYLWLILYLKKKEMIVHKFESYWCFYLFAIMFAFGSISQYDTFMRCHIMLYYLLSPFLLLFLHNIVGSTIFDIIPAEDSEIGFSEVFLYIGIIINISLSFALYLREYYAPMDWGFRLL